MLHSDCRLWLVQMMHVILHVVYVLDDYLSLFLWRMLVFLKENCIKTSYLVLHWRIYVKLKCYCSNFLAFETFLTQFCYSIFTLRKHKSVCYIWKLSILFWIPQFLLYPSCLHLASFIIWWSLPKNNHQFSHIPYKKNLVIITQVCTCI